MADRDVMKKGPWSADEDQKLITYIRRYGIWNWNHMAKPAGLARSGKSCRLRWMNYLRPNIKHGNFSQEEEEIVIRWQQVVGNRWSLIASKLEGRTDNEVKNYWNTRLKKRFVPVTESSSMDSTVTNSCWIKEEAESSSEEDTNSKMVELGGFWGDLPPPAALGDVSYLAEDNDDFEALFMFSGGCLDGFNSPNYSLPESSLALEQYDISDNLWEY